MIINIEVPSFPAGKRGDLGVSRPCVLGFPLLAGGTQGGKLGLGGVSVLFSLYFSLDRKVPKDQEPNEVSST